MRKLWVVLFAGLIALGAGSASAGTLAYSGSLSLGLGTLPGIQGTGSGLAIVNGSLGGPHITSLTVSPGDLGPVTVSVPVTASATVQSIRFSGIANLTGSFAGLTGSPPGGGPMGLSGLAKICLVFDASCTVVQVPVPFTPMAGVGFGVGGSLVIPGAVALTFQHAPWTIGQPVVNIHTPMSNVTTPMLPGGFAHDAGSGTSNTASGSSGVLQLVTVSRTFTSLTGAFPELPVFGTLNLHFVPEPGELLLLAAGGAALGLLGRARRRTRR